DYHLDVVATYKDTRNFPAKDGTSRLGPHLRFGTVGIRTLVNKVKDAEGTFLSELIWREFFMQILYHFPKVVNNNFREKYDAVPWRNNKEEFKKWCEGNTGYPIVDAGMRELNNTGYMHNRVRMITAGFLCKHLLIDWRWGEAYFAEKLLDYELAANNGNWQWAAGTGCDAAPYFRVFNPTTQIDKFDKQREYLDTWVPEYQSANYPEPMVEHKMARERAINTYKEALNS
ncbi:cryptochrome/photolyase family protein, partial [Gilvibacter sp.]|uniref:cryptochrome/photolyase family protein n=1 Tax=Gilvibacter sp. TaxID=2729997 RepID=UPI003F4A387D